MITIYYTKNQSWREKMVLALLNAGSWAHTKLYLKRKKWNINSELLSKYPANTLGYQLYLFYAAQKFEPIPKAEHHDVFHVLLNFTTGVKDETCMQFLLCGNGKHSPFTIGCCLVSLFTFPENFKSYKMNYRRGKNMLRFSNVDFHAHLNTDFIEFKKQFKIN